MITTVEQLAKDRNFRDVGEYVSKYFSVPAVAGGKLFRMGKLYQLSQWACDYLTSLGITDVLDLRSATESSAQPDVSLPEAREHSIDFSCGLLGLDQVIEFYRWAAEHPEDADGEAYIKESYQRMPRMCTQQVKRAVELITDRDDAVVLIHCAGGKDRTGFLVAVLLGAVGVSDDEIVRDYMASKRTALEDQQVLQRYLERFRGTYGLEIPEEVVLPFLTVNEQSIREMINTVRSEYTSFESYLTTGAGLPLWRVERLKRWLSGSCETSKPYQIQSGVGETY
ncbi:MAG: tyrosine-protein phosphatase [Spirochaetota bacterium]